MRHGAVNRARAHVRTVDGGGGSAKAGEAARTGSSLCGGIARPEWRGGETRRSRRCGGGIDKASEKKSYLIFSWRIDKIR